MTKTVLAALTILSLGAVVVAFADQVHDWHDLDAVHNHVTDAIKELARASAANHYDMAGHAKKAEDLLHQAEHELHDAVEAAKAGH
jgi:hypothetical protein